MLHPTPVFIPHIRGRSWLSLITNALPALVSYSEQRFRFLAKASALLSSSLDYKTTLRQVADVAASQLADTFELPLG